jgi:ribosomal protein S18 acetylase RimI-like enzyme
MMNGVSTRQARADDREFVWNLTVLCFREVVTRQFGEWDEAWQIENFEKHWNPEKCDVILRDGTPVGIRAVWQEADALFLSQVLIHPDYQNQGIGSSVVEGVMAQAKATGLCVRLQVLKENSRALSLYQRLGFSVSGVTDTHTRLEWKG